MASNSIRKAAASALVTFVKVWDSAKVVALTPIDLIVDGSTAVKHSLTRIARAQEVAAAAEWVRGEPAMLKTRKPPAPARKPFVMPTADELARAGAIAVPPEKVVYRQILKRDPTVVSTSGRTTDSTPSGECSTPRFGV